MSPHYKVTVGYLASAPPPVNPNWGSPLNRPDVAVRPDSTTSGIRQSPTTTMTGPQAMTAILAAPVESDGRRYLRRVEITSNLNLATTGSNALVFEDCLVDTRAAGGIYTISAFYAAGSVEPAVWPEFRYCTVRGGASATVRGGWCRFLRCDLSYGVDILKPFQAIEVWASYLHDCYRTPEAHCDIIQIVSGVSAGIFQKNNFVGFASADSPQEPSSWVSGVLQVGTITGAIGIPVSVQFLSNWVEGGRYGFRGSGGASDNPNNYPVSLVFRNNRFIRDSFQYGPVGNMHPTNDDFNNGTNVYDDNGEVIVYGG